MQSQFLIQPRIGTRPLIRRFTPAGSICGLILVSAITTVSQAQVQQSNRPATSNVEPPSKMLDTAVVVTPLDRLTISAIRDGRIESCDRRAGAIVKSGEVILRLGSERENFALRKAQGERRAAEFAAQNLGKIESLQAKHDLKKARLDLLESIDRQSSTKRINPSTPQERFELKMEVRGLLKDIEAETNELKQAKMQLEAKIAEESQARCDVDNSTVVAPFDGVIESLSRQPGDVVKQGEEIGVMIRLDQLQVNLLFFLDSISPGEILGKSILIGLDKAADGKPWKTEARITRVVPGINQSKTFIAYAEFENERFVNGEGISQWRIWPGMELQIIESNQIAAVDDSPFGRQP